jgi:Na+-driven multidrug efflux pump
VNSAAIPIVAYNYGAKNKARIDEAIRFTFMYNIVIMVVGTILFELLPVQFLRLFNASPEMLTIGIIGVRFLTSSFILAAVQNTSSTIMQSLGHGVNSMFIFSLMGKLDMVWISVPLADFMGSILAVILLIRAYRKIVSGNHSDLFMK